MRRLMIAIIILGSSSLTAQEAPVDPSPQSEAAEKSEKTELDFKGLLKERQLVSKLWTTESMEMAPNEKIRDAEEASGQAWSEFLVKMEDCADKHLVANLLKAEYRLDISTALWDLEAGEDALSTLKAKAEIAAAEQKLAAIDAWLQAQATDGEPATSKP